MAQRFEHNSQPAGNRKSFAQPINEGIFIAGVWEEQENQVSKRYQDRVAEEYREHLDQSAADHDQGHGRLEHRRDHPKRSGYELRRAHGPQRQATRKPVGPQGLFRRGFSASNAYFIEEAIPGHIPGLQVGGGAPPSA